MRLITVPPDIAVKFNDGDKVFTCKEVFIHQIDSYAEIKTASMMRQAQKVVDAIENGNGTISLEDADYDLLKAACSQIKYFPKVGRSILPFFDALDGAEKA